MNWHNALLAIGSYKVATMIKVSEELINDSAFNLPAYIAREFGSRIGNKEEDAFINGNGIGKPLGVLSDTGGAQIGVTAGSASAVSFDDLMDLVFSLKSPYRRKAKFLLHDQTVKLLRKVKDANGQYLWNPSVKDGEPDTVLNYPYYSSAYMPQVGAGTKAILFGDLSHYWVADRQGRIFKRLNELFAQTGQVGFLATQRVDGRLVLPEAIKLMKMKAS